MNKNDKEVYGRLRVTGKPRTLKRYGVSRGYYRVVEVTCECGTVKDARLNHLRSGVINSCGCLKKEKTGNLFRTHGRRHSRLYDTWNNMHRRCEDPSTDSYKYYGGRGIKVCAKWKSFEGFAAWADKTGYTDELTIDRKNNDLGYTESNCRWTNRSIQGLGKRPGPKPRSGYIGVHQVRDRYQARAAGKHIGMYDTPEEAAEARDEFVRAVDRHATFNF